jgi:hypothetical protein
MDKPVPPPSTLKKDGATARLGASVALAAAFALAFFAGMGFDRQMVREKLQHSPKDCKALVDKLVLVKTE